MLNNKNNMMRASEDKVDAVVFRDAATRIRPQSTGYAESLIDTYVHGDVPKIFLISTLKKYFISEEGYECKK